MMYDLVLSGNKTVTITEEQKKKVDALLEEEASGNITIMLGKNTIRLSMVKGIFESGTQSYAPLNATMEAKNQEWQKVCNDMSGWSLQGKIENELNTRILPMFQKEPLDEVTIAVLQQSIEAFFVSHPKYPRCPSHIWWEIVKQRTKGWATKWMEYVIENDKAIEEWIKFQKWKI